MAKFVWSKSRRSYIDKATGKAVSANQLVTWASEATDASKARVQKLAEQLNNGEITEREFQLAMRDEIDKGHSALWAVAFGGILAMSASRWAAARRLIGRQQGYFAGFAHDILTGRVSPAQLVNRAGMYGEAIYSTYVNGTVAREREIASIRRLIEPSLRRPALVPAPKPRGLLDYIAQRAATPAMRREAAAAGSRAYAAAIAGGSTAEEATAQAIAAIDAVLAGAPAAPKPAPPSRFVRRVLDPAAEHCTDCPELAGVYPIESVPPIGASECAVNCRCTIEFIDGTAEAAA